MDTFPHTSAVCFVFQGSVGGQLSSAPLVSHTIYTMYGLNMLLKLYMLFEMSVG